MLCLCADCRRHCKQPPAGWHGPASCRLWQCPADVRPPAADCTRLLEHQCISLWIPAITAGDAPHSCSRCDNNDAVGPGNAAGDVPTGRSPDAVFWHLLIHVSTVRCNTHARQKSAGNVDTLSTLQQSFHHNRHITSN